MPVLSAIVANSTAKPSVDALWPVWITDPTSIPFLHAADFWFGSAGFVITLATFGLGWRKLLKVERAAKAAQKAVEDMKLRVSRYDATVDASEALYSYREISRHLDAPDWRGIVVSMSNVRHSAIRMDKILEEVDQTTAKELKRAANKLDKHIRVIEEAISSASPYPEQHVIRASIRTGEEVLVKAKRLIEDVIS
ncbi:hypothetical protein [Sphingomonas sp.]|uniref:hypothetical protein n=1 Tax=Sphingomonas sp. TaxID=28214 RepID=UPI0035BBE2DE